MKKVFTTIAAVIFFAQMGFAGTNDFEKTDGFVYFKSSNPSIEVEIEDKNYKKLPYQVIDTEGKIVEKGKAPVNEKFQIDIQNLPAGKYKLKIGSTISFFEVR